MKTFTQISEILDFARDFHQHCETLYRQLRDESDSNTLALVIGQMERHEQAMQHCLDRYRQQAPSAIIDTWVQFAPEESADEIIRDMRTGGGLNPDQLFAFGNKLDAALRNTYRHLAEDAESEDVRELFTGLLEMIRSGEKKRTANQQALRDHML